MSVWYLCDNMRRNSIHKELVSLAIQNEGKKHLLISQGKIHTNRSQGHTDKQTAAQLLRPIRPQFPASGVSQKQNAGPPGLLVDFGDGCCRGWTDLARGSLTHPASG